MGGRWNVAVLVATVLVVANIAAPVARTAPPAAQVRTPAAAITVLDAADPVALAVATSAALFGSAPAAVLDGDGDPAARAAAEAAGVPLLLTPDEGDAAGVAAELDRLGARTVLATDPAAAGWATGAGREVVDDPAALEIAPAPGLPAVDDAADAPRPLLVLATEPVPAAAATARAAGADVEVVPGADPRADADLLGVARPAHVLALGAAFGPPERLDHRLAVAATGVELPGGGQVLFPGRRMVALYGHPGAAAMGVLGEQPVGAAVERARALAREYDPVVEEPVVPAFELISTVADTGPGPDGDFSAEATVDVLLPWVDAAAAAGMYVVLDLQPGRTDFLTQAKRYEELLVRPHVGLALDPEWRLGPGQRHLAQIGSVGVDEVNAVVTWLADLTRAHVLPQKLLLLHQFRTSMITGRERLDTSRGELAILIHADGFGTPDLKFATWHTLHVAAPPGIWWGWKNFYDEDRPMFTPQQTMAIEPAPPMFVSFQ